MQLGIFAKTFAGTSPDAVLSATAEAGYTAAQYNMACSGLASMPDAIPDDVAKAVAHAAKAAGITLAAVSGTYNMIHPDIVKREAGLARLGVIASACRAMGTGMVTVCTGTRDPDDQWRAHPDNDGADSWRDLLAAMERASLVAEQHDIVLGIEPELANVVNSPAKARTLIDELRSPRLKIILDPANLFEHAALDEQHRIVSAAIDLLGDRIAMAHAKDRAADGNVVAAGQGTIDFHHYFRELQRIGFDGPVITHGLSAAEAGPVNGFLREAMTEAGLRLA